MEFTYQEESDIPRAELLSLYESVGWTVYTANPENLERAVQNSSFVLAARSNNQLVGLARVLSDDVSIMYLQDILVSPMYQRNGVGRELLERCLERFSHVRQKVLLTDNRPEQKAFYGALGFHNIGELERIELNAFVRYEGIELS